MPHGSDYFLVLFVLEGKTPPSPAVLSPPSLHITILWRQQLLCCLFKPHQSLEITLIFLLCGGLKGMPKSAFELDSKKMGILRTGSDAFPCLYVVIY